MAELTQHFAAAFGGHGSIVMTCNCGRTFFEDDEGAGGWEKDELEGLREKAKANPDKYVGWDCTVSGMHLAGRTFVHGCPCNGAAAYEEFIWNNRRGIAMYLKARTAKIIEREKKVRADLQNV